MWISTLQIIDKVHIEPDELCLTNNPNMYMSVFMKTYLRDEVTLVHPISL